MFSPSTIFTFGKELFSIMKNSKTLGAAANNKPSTQLSNYNKEKLFKIESMWRGVVGGAILTLAELISFQ